MQNIPVSGQDVTPVKPAVYPSSMPANYVRTWNATSPEPNSSTLLTKSLRDVKQVTQYMDGFGRPLQAVIKQGSYPTGGSAVDMVTSSVYDALGRELRTYLPFAASTYGGNTSVSDGAFKFNPFDQQQYFYSDANAISPIKQQGETFYYGKTNFESSPLNRAIETYAPGNSWIGSEGSTKKGNKTNYQVNTDIDAVRIWTVTNNATLGLFGAYSSSAFYPAGKLFKNITTDENSKQVIEFKDLDGKVILKKVQLTAAADQGTGSGHSGWLCTYYIYDVLNQLRCVIQPLGVELISPNWLLTDVTILAEQCFRYEYDSRNRMVVKKVPGAGEVYMIYDAKDRMVLSQDAKMRTGTIKWMYTQYDGLNRPVSSGLWNSTSSFSTHYLAAYSSSSYPTLSGTWEELTKTFYDDYNWLTTNTGHSFISTRSATDDAYLLAVSSSWPYPVSATAQSAQLKGMVTGSKVKVLETGTYLYSIQYYDDKGRVIQTQAQNIVGKDIATTQYTWTGQPLLTIQRQEKTGANAQTSIVVSQLGYDDLGRLIKTEKKLSTTLVNSNAMSAYKTIAEIQYDASGNVKKKKIGNKPGAAAGTALANLDFEYNIRGWLLSINKAYVDNATNADQYFGMQLGYDKNSTLGSFLPQYNGNIGGTIWKSEGDQKKRKYDFTYDAVNRLSGASFTQYVSGTGAAAIFNTSAGIDFSVENLLYDANGNILRMWQKGVKATTSDYIDKLTYNYTPKTNKLLNVIDLLNETTTKLGDFRASSLYQSVTPNKTAATVDYTYDVNGNLVKDLNKDIATPAGGDAIQYNHLNLPSVIGVRKDLNTSKGTITYTYDAGGNKLKKVTVDASTAGKTITTTTTYVSGFVYESKTTAPVDTQNPDYTDVLQFVGQEEGRIRFKPLLGSIPANLQYDYFIKDHLGNVRMVLTEEVQTLIYPAATLEGTYSATGATQVNSMINYEKGFYNIDNTKVTLETGIVSWPSETVANTKLYYNHNGNPPTNINYPSSCTPIQTDGSTKLYKLNATSNRTGLEFMIKVMAGDKIDILGKSYFLNTATVTNANTPLDLAALMANMLLTPGNAAASKGITSSQLTSINTGQVPGTFFRGTNGEVTTIPKAYINYIFLDEQFKYAGGNFSRAGASGIVKDHWQTDPVLQNIRAPKNGYIFVYISNESNVDVFFDNLQVIHKPGPILEETHYYPFGLTMSGISSKAAGELQNKDKTFQGQKFDDDLGLNWVEFKYRNHDPQIGRFIEIDPLANEYVYNSTYAFSENKVTGHVELEGLECVGFNLFWDAVKKEISTFAGDIDRKVTKVFTLSTYIPVKTSTNGPVTVTNGVRTTNTSETSTNLKGNADYIMNNNTNIGNNEPLTKTTNTTTVSNETLTSVNSKPVSGSYKFNIDQNGNKTTEAGLTISRNGIDLGVTTTTDSNGSLTVEGSAGASKGPATVKSIVSATSDGKNSNIQMGVSVEVKKGAATVTASSTIKIFF
ncbi:MAG: DUF6443 domain-containing protein [Ferruginibacter sp.]